MPTVESRRVATRRRVLSSARDAILAGSIGFPLLARSAPRDANVAMLLPFQGSQARAAESVRQGVDSALEQANRAGGIKGQTLKLLPVDNGYDAQKTIAAINSLADKDSAVAITSLVGGPIIGAAIPAATKAGVPIVGVLHGGDVFRGAGTEIVTHVRAPFDAEFRAIASVFPTVGRRRFAVLHATDKSGVGFLAQFSSVLKSYGLSVAAAIPYDRDTTDFAPHTEAVKRSGADLLLIGSTTGPAIAVIRAKVATNLLAQVVCLSTVDDRAVWEELGPSSVHTAFSSVVPNPYGILLPLSREYQAAMAAKRYEQLSLSSFEGYINARVLVEGMRRAPTIDRSAIQATLRTMRSVALSGVTFSAATAETPAGINVADILLMTHQGKMLR